MAFRQTLPAFTGLPSSNNFFKRHAESQLCLRSRSPLTIFGTRGCTMSSVPLPSLSELRATKFPGTSEQASKILHHAAQNGFIGAPILQLLSALASTSHGARGLFVALLADPEVHFADNHPIDPSFITMLASTEGEIGEEESAKTKLKSHAEYIRSLAVKNVVMPAAMVYRYRVNGESELMKGSALTRDRAIRVAAAWHKEDEARKQAGLQTVTVCDTARDMQRALDGRGGIYESFVRHWGYGVDECSIMVDALREAFGADLDKSSK